MQLQRHRNNHFSVVLEGVHFLALGIPLDFYRPRSFAKKGDNTHGSVRPFVCLCALSCLLSSLKQLS